MIDAHIHIDQYTDEKILNMLQQDLIFIGVAMDYKSCMRLLDLQSERIHIAFGYHPEQDIQMDEVYRILELIDVHHDKLAAIGEVGLPQYLRREKPSIHMEQYIHVLELFIEKAAQYQLPVVLHAVYDDALIALQLLKKHHIKRAHFHWFKASDDVISQVLESEYMVSVTPDILWNKKTRKVAEMFPLTRIMAETDGPWQHEGFVVTEIKAQISAIMEELQKIHQNSDVQSIINRNTKIFYHIED